MSCVVHLIDVHMLSAQSRTQGFEFFLACFYSLVIGLIMSVVLSVWVGASFQQNRFDHVW
jgi:hypothetical protein